VKLESESESDAALAAAKLPVRIFSSFSLSSLPSIFCLLLLLLQAVNLAKLWFIIASQSKCENLPFACLLATMKTFPVRFLILKIMVWSFFKNDEMTQISTDAGI